MTSSDVTNFQNEQFLIGRGYQRNLTGDVAYTKDGVNLSLSAINSSPHDYFKALVLQLEEKYAGEKSKKSFTFEVL